VAGLGTVGRRAPSGCATWCREGEGRRVGWASRVCEIGREKEGGGGGWEAGRGTRDLCWAPSGPLGLGFLFFCFFYFFSNFKIYFKITLKFIIIIPKLFINKIFIFLD
jgi:hypothetical protein